MSSLSLASAILLTVCLSKSSYAGRQPCIEISRYTLSKLPACCGHTQLWCQAVLHSHANCDSLGLTAHGERRGPIGPAAREEAVGVLHD